MGIIRGTATYLNTVNYFEEIDIPFHRNIFVKVLATCVAIFINPNEAELFEGSFFWGINLTPFHMSRRINPISI